MITRQVKLLIHKYRYEHRYRNTTIGFGTYLSDNVQIGSGSIVSGGCYLVDSSVGPDTEVGSHCSVERTVIAGETKIGRDCVIDQSDFGRNVTVQRDSFISKTTIASNVSIYRSCSIQSSQINRFTFIAAESRLSNVVIGKFCSVGPFTVAGHGDHPTNFISTCPVFYSTSKQCGVTFTNENRFHERTDIIIGNDVWIGARVFIRDGVKIGNGAIVGAGAVVVKDVPDYAVVGGVPAQIIRMRFDPEQIHNLLNVEWWNWQDEKLIGMVDEFTQPDVDKFLQRA